MSSDKLGECPLCKGTGKFEFPKVLLADTMEIKKRIAKELRSRGYSIRQIQHALNYRSTNSVAVLLKKKSNHNH